MVKVAQLNNPRNITDNHHRRLRIVIIIQVMLHILRHIGSLAN